MIIMMGVAGSGKSVQGKLLADKLGYRWLSSGEFLRQRIVGAKRQDMLQGKLLGDQEMIEIFDDMISDYGSKNRCILDGFPRTIDQAKWLLDQHDKGRIKIDGVILLEASQEAVKARLLQRGRPDDNEEAIATRFTEYREITSPIIDIYRQHNIPIHNVNGEREIEEINQEIIQLTQKA